MSAPQIITTPGGEEMVVLSRRDYDDLLAAAAEAEEDAADVAIYDRRKAELTPDDILPPEVSALMLSGDSRLKAMRKWRHFSQVELADRAGIAQGFLSDLERRSKTASPETAAALAAALNVPAAWLAD
ncbi:XRE family transcriptional regulator [Caulobacter sp. CCUG 60055]|uniref:helix-turn-helix domain-containing protein n=1 Tax=Caulobacter sp. CCUG 60055 TaxID=2100090 RepID=UPI001FA72643|nr:helix-turn-helix transcriptional regulator [Caulobacter sp. CCUG 60055]MBQ1542348.1 helix-turn-helix transcriptional regulator [Caulobacteraceae bacterium]MCI3181408.1 XRE family transcriptional regulator [Caulobacter sp. CCUG 60055]